MTTPHADQTDHDPTGEPRPMRLRDDPALLLVAGIGLVYAVVLVTLLIILGPM